MKINPINVTYCGDGTFQASEEDCLFFNRQGEALIISEVELDYLFDKIHSLEEKIQELKYN